MRQRSFHQEDTMDTKFRMVNFPNFVLFVPSW